MLDLADAMKADRFGHRPLAGPRTVAVLFDKPSTRTRISFAVGVAELGGQPLRDRRGRVAARPRRADRGHRPGAQPQVAAIVWRTFGQDRMAEMAAASTVPVINALTDTLPPLPGAGRPADDPGRARPAGRAGR